MTRIAHVATRKGLFTLNESWSIERLSFPGLAVTMVFDDPSTGFLFAALLDGHHGARLHRSSDGGHNWHECGAPTFPPQLPREREAEQSFACPVPWSTAQIWTLDSGEPGVLWAGTIPGGLFRSDDAGDTWLLVRSLWDCPQRAEWFGAGQPHPGIHSICIDPRDYRAVQVAVSCGGIWRTMDHGQSWSCDNHGMSADYVPPQRATDPVMQDVRRLVQCKAAPDCFWAQHRGGVHRSCDGGRTWQALSSSYGFTAAVHPHDPETAWFVPAGTWDCRIPVGARLVVIRTRDGGRTFEDCGAGLPAEHVYDIVYRHGLAVDRSGQRLLLGSTTGGLWLSSDGGDSWRCLYGHLPPINAVRFASEGD
jgi:hypothetical protein